MVQPQPSGGCTLQWELTGDEAVGAGGQGSLMASSQGSLKVPPELAGNEVVLRLLTDNHQLREALKRSNDALRERCEEMEGWQRRSREEREFLSCRFREARSLVQRLAQENQSLQGQLNHSITQTGSPNVDISKEIGSQGQDQEQKCTNTEKNVLVDSPEVLREAAQTNQAEGDTDKHHMPQSLPAKGSNEILKLLKSHKEKLEEGVTALRKRNEELEKEKVENEKERENLLATVEQLRSKLTQNGGGVTEESVQQTCALTVPAERYKELQEKLDCLQKNSVQRDRTEALLKQKEKEFAQLTKDSDALRAQVTSLLGELNERQNWLEKSEAEKRLLEDKLCKKTERLQILEREIEQQKKQHSVTVDNLLLQTQSLETALKNERLVIVEERRKLAQLQHAYTCLFQDYDSKLKSDNRGGEADTANRLAEAEKALALKQELIDKLKEDTEQLRATLETIPVLNAQAEIYKMDFLAEREAREKLNQKKEELQEELTKAKAEIDRLKQEGTSRARIEEMQQRHMEDYRPRPHLPPSAAPFAGAAMFNPAQPPSARRREDAQDELPDYRCPKCMYKAPDMDTLQIHVMDCIQ
ncbi:NF-kappa-B essential modulator isoform X2 [Misgurnus anguillicaudatus]|uniref:NF-kappa-B essential modulator isoform X2 n=1 Tax=Misgurnus anguillicaudatus TaxID=75329 RepID=UPI00243587F4|nr:NF-kappa-B essential modulator isoform X2 [Misgurnus anguillicaudatus]